MKWLRYLAWLGIVLCGLVLALLSPWGTRLTIHLADLAMPQLEIEQVSGSLFSELVLGRSRFEQDGMTVDTRELMINMQWSCLFDLDLCLEQVKIKSISIRLQPQPTIEPENSTETPELIELPLKVSVNKLIVGQFTLEIPETLKLTWKQLSTQFSMEERLHVRQLTLLNPILELPVTAPSSDAEPLDFKQIAHWQYQPVELQNWTVPLNAMVDRLEVRDFELRQPQTVLSVTELNSALQLENNHLTVEHLDLLSPPYQAQLKGTLRQNYQHDLALTLEAFSAAPFSGKVELTLVGNLDNTALKADISGDLEAKLVGNVSPSDPMLPISLSSEWQALDWSMGGDKVSIKAGHFSLSGDLNDYRLTLSSGLSSDSIPPLTADLNALARPNRVQVETLEVHTLSGLAQLNGTLTIDESAKWLGRVTLQDIQPQAKWPQFEGNISGEIPLEAQFYPQRTQLSVADLQLSGQWQNYPLDMSGQVDWNSEDGLNLPQFLLRSGDNRIEAVLTLDRQNNLSGNLKVDAPELAQLYPRLSGKINATLDLFGTAEQPGITTQMQLTNGKFNNLSLASAQLQGELIWDQVKPVSLDVEMSGLSLEGEPIEAVNLSLQGEAKQHQLSLDVKSQSVQFTTQLSGQLSEQSWDGVWQQGRFISLWGDYQLDSPDTAIHADWQQNQYQIGSHCWQDNIAALCVRQARYTLNQGEIDVYGEKLELLQILTAYVPQLKPMESDSKLNFTLQGKWLEAGNANARLDASLTPGTIKLPELAEPIRLQKWQLGLVASEQALQSTMELSTAQLGDLSSQISLRDWPEQELLNGSLSGQITISSLKLLPLRSFVPQLSELEGQIDGQLTISGKPAEPDLQGQLNVADLTLAGDALPTRVSRWNQTVDFNGKRATLEGTFYLGEGAGRSNGFVDWSDSPNGELRLQGEAFELDYRNTVRATFSPDIRVTANSDLIELKGKVDVLRARVKVKELPPDAAAPSEDTVIVNQPAVQQDASIPIKMDLTVNIDPQRQDQVKLDAFGLQTDLQGSMKIKQENDKLTGNGDLNLINGRYQAYGQDLQIRTGEILFNGPMDRPTLNIEAIRDPEKTADDVIAGIRVTGPAESPQVDIFSIPAMEQSEALSYLLQGKSLKAQGERPDDSLLASVLINAGLSGSENRFNRLGRKLGIEDLTLDTAGSGETTQIAVSGYIAPGVQLRYVVGVFDSVAQVALRYQLLPRLYVEAVKGAESAVDVYYQFSRGEAQTNESQEDEDQQPEDSEQRKD